MRFPEIRVIGFDKSQEVIGDRNEKIEFIAVGLSQPNFERP